MINVQSATATNNYYLQSSSSTPVNVAQALSAIKVNPRSKFDIQDSAANIEKNLSTLISVVNNVKSIVLTDTNTGVMSLTAKQLLSQGGTALTSKMNLGGANKISLKVADVLAKDVAAVRLNTRVSKFSVRDTSTNIATKMEVLSAGLSKIEDIQVSNSVVPIKITATQYLNYKKTVLDHLSGTYGLEISGASTTQALDMAIDDNVSSISIVDHAQNIVDHLDDLQEIGLKVKSVSSDNGNLFKVSADQLQKDGAIIGKLYKGYQLAVFNLDAGAALAVKSNKKIVSIDVVDTAANISKHLSIFNRMGSQLHSLQLSDNNSLEMSAREYFGYGTLLSKVVDFAHKPLAGGAPTTPAASNNNYKVNITDARAVDAEALKSDGHISAISVSDTSSAIAVNLDDLTNNSLVQNIKLNGTGTILDISANQWTADTDVIDLLKSQNGNLKFNVRGVLAADAYSLISTSDNRIASVSISDSGENIVTSLSDLATLGKSLVSITQTDARRPNDPGHSLELSASEWMANIGVLSKIVGGYGVNLTNVSAAKALALGNDIRVRSFEVTDTAASISANLDALQGLGPKLTAINQSDVAAIQLTGMQYKSYADSFNKFGPDYKLSVQSAAANQVATLIANQTHIQSIQVSDTAVNVASNLAHIQDAASLDQNETSISVTITTTDKLFTLTAQEVETYSSALDSIRGGYQMSVTDVLASDALSLAENSHVLSMSVQASASDLSSTSLLTDLKSLGNKIEKIVQTDAETDITLSVDDWESNSVLLSKINGYQVALTEVKAASAESLLKNIHVDSVSVVDGASQISSNFDTLKSLGASLVALTQTDGDDGDVQLNMNQWLTGTSTLAKFLSPYSIEITNANSIQAQTLSSESSIASIKVEDIAAGLTNSYDDLVNNAKLTSVRVLDPLSPIALTADQLTNGNRVNGIIQKIQGGYVLAISDADVSGLSDLLNDSHVVSAEMKGTGDDVTTSLPELSQLGDRLKSLTITDANPTIDLSFTDYQKYKSVLAKIGQSFNIAVSNMKVRDAIIEGSSGQFSLQMNVVDSAAQVALNLDSLAQLGSKLMDISTTGNLPVLSVQAYQVAADKNALDKLNVNANSPRYQLSVSGADLSSANKLINDDVQTNRIVAIDLTDSAAVISQGFAVVQSNKVAAVHLTPNSSTLAITGAQYADVDALDKIKGTFELNVRNATADQAIDLQADSRVVSFDITSDTTDIADTLPDLLPLSKLDQINITQDAVRMSLTMNDFNSLQVELSKLSGAYGLELTEVKLADLTDITGRNDVAVIDIQDTSAAIATNWNDLVGLGGKLSAIDTTTPLVDVAITYEQWLQSSSTLAKLSNGQGLALLDVPAAEATTASGLASVNSVSVKGSPGEIAYYFDDLNALGDALDNIELDSEGIIALTQTQIDADINGATVAKINGEFTIEISA